MLSLKDREGRIRLLWLLLAIIFFSSLLGQLFQTDFGKIKIEQITTDFRGAELNGELYYPAGTSSQDKLPAVVVTHGGGCGYGVTKGIASELARRGFVVFNMSAYGSGMSTWPKYDELGNGESGVVIFMTTMGLLDGVDFVRNLAFVDETRVGLIGHSMGAGRAATTAKADCGFLTLNDALINLLSDSFGQKFTEEEILLDADTLAADRLNDAELAEYNLLRAEKAAYFDSRLKSVILMGLDMVPLYSEPVSIAGHEVTRNVNCNVGYFSGEYDSFWSFPDKDGAKSSWYSSDINFDTWYSLDDNAGSSEVCGNLYDTSVVDNAKLKEAFDNRDARIVSLASKETHSRDFFSTKMSTMISRYFEQTLGYNNGELGSASSSPIAASKNIWPWRSILNCIAMFAMFTMIIVLAAMLLSTKFFGACLAQANEDARPKLDKKGRVIVSILTAVVGFLAIYIALGSSGLVSAMVLNPSALFPVTRNAFMTGFVLLYLVIGTVLIVMVTGLLSKKNGAKASLSVVFPKIGFVKVLKCILLAITLVAAAYASLGVINYFFGQDYRFWMTIFPLMKADYWFIALRYAVPFFFMYLLIGAGINYTTRSDIPEWKDTLNAVIINSVGIWICALINYAIVFFNGYQGVFFCNFFIAYQILLVFPVTVLFTRKMYKLTNTLWVGAALNSLLVSWSLTAATGLGDIYVAQTTLGNFLNF